MKRRTPKNRIPLSQCALSIALCCLLLLYGFPMSVTAEPVGTQLELVANANAMLAQDHASGELLVTFPGNISVSQAQATLDDVLGETASYELIFECRDKRPDSPIIFLTLVPESNELGALRTLLAHEDVLYVEPNYAIELEPSLEDVTTALTTISTASETTSPYDPYEQWALDTIGVADAWESGFTGSADIKVGVIDSGISTHEDLDDHVDMTLAFNGYEPTSTATDDLGHGTFVSGIIGAELNGVGITGVCQNITIVPLKIDGWGEEGNYDQYIASIVCCVDYALSRDIDILNLSAKLPYSQFSDSLIASVEAFGGLFITTAGNSAMDMANDPTTIGKRHNEANWIVVGASTSNDEIASYSNYSATYCDLFAPGSAICSTYLNGEYATMSGTSFAAPYVTAAAALIMSHATHLTASEVKSLLLSSVDTVSAFEGKCVSEGRLSLINAINQLYSENRGAYTLGDLDGDGIITSSDATISRQIALQTVTPTEQQSAAADINGDGNLNGLDYSMISKFVNRTRYFPPV